MYSKGIQQGKHVNVLTCSFSTLGQEKCIINLI